MSEQRKTGWGRPSGARKWHYFGADGRSLCRQYAWLGLDEELDDTYDTSPENCARCKRKRLQYKEVSNDPTPE
jgi:hypothetical protein